MSSEKQYIDLYEQYLDTINKHACDVLNAPRSEAADQFRRNGFPSRKQEAYKYTDVDKAFAPDFGVNLNRVPVPINPYASYRCPVPGLGGNNFFVVNDTFCAPPASNPLNAMPEGVIIDSLLRVAEAQPALVEKYYARLAQTTDGITALNTMLTQDGLFVYIPRDVKIETPIQIVNIAHALVDFMNNRRLLVVLEEGAEATLLFCDHAIEEHRFLNTQVVEVFVEKNATLSMYNLEETNSEYVLFNNLYVQQEAGSHVTLNALMLHNGLTRNRLHLRLAGERATLDAYGVVVADKQQHVDNHALIEHVAPRCMSNILYKYLLDDQATGAFAGHVYVHKDAQHTDSQETNANICVSKDAHMYTRPMLEIYADDVKCNHGSTVGQLDETALFYMRQRGIPEAEARILLQHAFVNDVIRRINVESLRERLSNVVEMRFRGAPDPSCKQCGMFS